MQQLQWNQELVSTVAPEHLDEVLEKEITNLSNMGYNISEAKHLYFGTRWWYTVGNHQLSRSRSAIKGFAKQRKVNHIDPVT